MATPRKRWTIIENSLLRESWSRDMKLTAVLLAACMSDRWAADLLTADQGARALLSPGDLTSITGSTDQAKAIQSLKALSKVVTMKVTVKPNGFVMVHWPKLPTTQRWPSLPPAPARPAAGLHMNNSGPASGPSCSSSSSVREEKIREELPPAEELPPVDAPEPASNSDPAAKPAPQTEVDSRVLNLLSKLEGDRAEKLAWLADTGPQIEVDAVSYSKAVPSLTVSYYRRYLAGERRFRDAAEKLNRQARIDAKMSEYRREGLIT